MNNERDELFSSDDDFHDADDQRGLFHRRSHNDSLSDTQNGRSEAIYGNQFEEHEHRESQGLLSGDDEDRPNDQLSQVQEYTVEEAVEHIGFGRFQIKIFLVCGLFSATDALEMLLLSVLSPELRCEWMLEEWQVALITTVVFVGMFIGSSFWGLMADKYGRWPIMMLAAVWIGYFGVLCAFSPNYPWMLVLRGLVGMGFGGAVQSFVLQVEYLPRKVRPYVLILSNIMWALGSTFEVGLTRLVIAQWDLGWRWLVGLSALPMILSMGAVWTLPESARYLVAAGRQQEAIDTLQNAAKLNGTTLPPGRLVKSVQAPRGNLRDLLCTDYLRTTCQLWLLWLGTACSYYGIVLAQSEILEFHASCGTEPGLEESPLHEQCHCNKLSVEDYNDMIYATLGEFVAIPFNMLTIDLLGRRATIAIDYVLAGIFFLLIQICATRTWLTLFIFGVRAFTSGIFNTVYIYTGEVFPTTVRSLGLGTSSAWARVGAMVTPFIAQVMLKASLTMSLWMYGGLCLVCAVCAMLLPIETKGREMPQTF